jgi:hypothetical protein
VEISPSGLFDAARSVARQPVRLASWAGGLVGAAVSLLDTDPKQLKQEVPLYDAELALRELRRAVDSEDLDLQKVCLGRLFKAVVTIAVTETEIPNEQTVELARAVIADLEPQPEQESDTNS